MLHDDGPSIVRSIYHPYNVRTRQLCGLERSVCARNVTNSDWVCHECALVAGERAGKRCKWLIIKPPEPADNGLKIRVSAVRFCPWPPLKSETCIGHAVAYEGEVSIFFPGTRWPRLNQTNLKSLCHTSGADVARFAIETFPGLFRRRTRDSRSRRTLIAVSTYWVTPGCGIAGI